MKRTVHWWCWSGSEAGRSRFGHGAAGFPGAFGLIRVCRVSAPVVHLFGSGRVLFGIRPGTAEFVRHPSGHRCDWFAARCHEGGWRQPTGQTSDHEQLRRAPPGRRRLRQCVARLHGTETGPYGADGARTASGAAGVRRAVRRRTRGRRRRGGRIGRHPRRLSPAPGGTAATRAPRGRRPRAHRHGRTVPAPRARTDRTGCTARAVGRGSRIGNDRLRAPRPTRAARDRARHFRGRDLRPPRAAGRPRPLPDRAAPHRALPAGHPQARPGGRAAGPRTRRPRGPGGPARRVGRGGRTQGSAADACRRRAFRGCAYEERAYEDRAHHDRACRRSPRQRADGCTGAAPRRRDERPGPSRRPRQVGRLGRRRQTRWPVCRPRRNRHRQDRRDARMGARRPGRLRRCAPWRPRRGRAAPRGRRRRPGPRRARRGPVRSARRSSPRPRRGRRCPG